MKSPRLSAAFVLLVLLGMLGLVAPLSAADTAAPMTPVQSVSAVDALSPLVAPLPAVRLCPSFYCPIYYPNDCSCDWIQCPNGEIVCGVWNGTSAAATSALPQR